MADEDGIRFVKRLLADYYRKQVGIGPERLDQREFGVGDFERKIAFRHLAFRSSDELRRYLAA